jgi:hypothetical protein
MIISNSALIIRIAGSSSVLRGGHYFRSALLGLCFCLFAIAISAGAASQYDDEFNGTTLDDHRWLVTGGKVQLKAGQAVLSAQSDAAGQLMLAFGPARLTQPWAVETQIERPAGNAFRCGLSVRLTSPQGLESVVGIARQGGDEGGVVLLGGAEKAKIFTLPNEIANATKLVLRIESASADLTTVRCGVRLPDSTAWTWSEPSRLEPKPVYIESIRLASFPTTETPGRAGQVAFDYFHCEGKDFVPNPPPPQALALLQRAAKMHPFDLETRAELAINAMTSVTDPLGGGPFIFAWFSQPYHFDVPQPVHGGEYIDGLTMARIISGSEQGLAAEKVMARVDQDILVDGFNWGKKGQTIDVATHKHTLPGLLTLYRLHPEDRHPLDLVKESLQKFHRVALRGKLANGEPYLYFPVADKVSHSSEYSGSGYDRQKGWDGHTREPIDTGSAGFQGVLTLPIAEYYEMTHDPEAKEFLDEFIRFLLERSTDFNPDASFTRDADVTSGQVWSRMMTMEGILIYGLASGRSDLVDWAHRAFDQARRLHGTRFGWLPENLNFNHGLGCETDTMTAQIEIAFLLARKVDDHYWEEAERIAMNQLVAQQLTRVDFLGGPTAAQAAEALQQAPDEAHRRLPVDPEHLDAELGTQVDFEQIPLRLLGSFASFCSPNEWDNLRPEQNLGANYLTMSSNASGMHALYNIWYHAAWWENTDEGLTLKVNLHWSKNLPGAQVISYFPAAAKLEIRVERPCHIILRQPDWAPANKTQVRTISESGALGAVVPFTQHGRWLHMGPFEQKTRLQIDFPDEVVTRRDIIYTRTPGAGYYGPMPPGTATKWGEAVFTTRWRGNSVISIEPDGLNQPNYQGRDNIPPYIPRHTATWALDPVQMSPVETTAESRTEKSLQ